MPRTAASFGAYFQEDFSSWTISAWRGHPDDKFGNIETRVLAPRITACSSRNGTLDPGLVHKAFRSPAAVKNFLDQRSFAPFPPRDLRPLIPILSVVAPPLVPWSRRHPFRRREDRRNPNLKEVRTAYEVAYTGTSVQATPVWRSIGTTPTTTSTLTSVLPSASFPLGIQPVFDVYTPANAADTGIPGPLYSFMLLAWIPGARFRARSYLSQPRAYSSGWFRGLAGPPLERPLHSDGQLLLPEEAEDAHPRPGTVSLLPEEVALSPETVQRIPALERQAFVGSANVNYSARLLVGRALHAATRLHRLLHLVNAIRREVADGKVITEPEGDQPAERRHPAAHLRDILSAR